MHRFFVRLVLTCSIAPLTPLASLAISIDTVPIRNPGNVDDSHGAGYGGVAYEYRIGTTEVTNAQYVAFLNAVAVSDPFGLYNEAMGSNTRGGILRSGADGGYSYSVKPDAVGQGPGGGNYGYANKPVVYVSWGDAARFSNWLHNGQPTGAQNGGTTENGAYALNGALTNDVLLAVARNASATWFIPSEDEWYKAAYYDATDGTYDDYPTHTNTLPNNNIPSLDTGNSANFKSGTITPGSPGYPFTDAGAYSNSSSAYGTFDQAGNVFEWNEAVLSSSYRGLRGGAYDNSYLAMQAANRDFVGFPNIEVAFIGFRVAAVPEPASIVMGLIGAAAFGAVLIRKRRARI